MMFKKFILVYLLLVFIGCGIYAHAALIDFYKKGPIVLKPDPDYAKLDYETLFYDNLKNIAVTNDGTIFVANRKQHNIYKFKDGKLVKKFGQDGLGVGDTRYPGRISILDNKYLVIQEDIRIGMISVFNFEGKCVKKIKISNWVWDAVALKNDKIAILCKTGIQDRISEYSKVRVIIKDINTNQEITVVSFDTTPSKVYEGNKPGIHSDDYDPQFYLMKIGDGNLLFGYSEWNELSVYTIDGKKIYSFRVNYQKKKVTQEMKDESRRMALENVASKPKFKEIILKADWSHAFCEWVPFYKNIAVDSDNNILVFEHTGFHRIKDNKFQVYSKDGKYLGESKLDTGTFKNRGSELELIYQNGYIYSLLERKDTDDILLNFVKVKTRD